MDPSIFHELEIYIPIFLQKKKKRSLGMIWISTEIFPCYWNLYILRQW